MSDPSLRAFLASITGWLSEAGIDYMVAGSFASTLHGRPRSTQVVDIVMDTTEAALRCFLDRVPEETVYVDAGSALEALRRRDMFNLIHLETGWKAHMIVRKDRPFSVTEFKRRRMTRWLGLNVAVASPEDVILSKLEWSKMAGGSERQRNDITGVLASNEGALDTEYMAKWVARLGLRG
ncbi:MAG: hypothetical protein AAF938_01440 [Myxococcota bacterium]